MARRPFANKNRCDWLVSTYFTQFAEFHIRLQFSEAYVRLKAEKEKWEHIIVYLQLTHQLTHLRSDT